MGLEFKLGSILLYHILKPSSLICVRNAVNLSFKILGDNSTEEPPIVLLHGILSSKSEWKGIGKTIANLTKRSVVVVDLRNHGGSPHVNTHKYDEMADDLVQLFDKLEIGSASIVGHNMGGRAAMYLSLVAPSRAKSLVIVDISPISTATQFKDIENVLRVMNSIDFGKAKNVSEAKKECKKQLRNHVKDDKTMQCILSNVILKPEGNFGFRSNVDVLSKHVKYITSFPKQSLKSKKYTGPCLFLGGQYSDYIHPDDLPQIRELFPVSVVAYIPKTGHYLYNEDQKTFLELTIDFLKTGE